jgi:uncharacterized protein (TIGR02246 family)
MSSTTPRAGIEAVLDRVTTAHAERDADTIAKSYSPDAVIYDLAPPLGRRGMNRDHIAAWLAGWEGPIHIDWRDVSMAVEGKLAFVSALNRMRGRQSGQDRDLWYRATLCLRKAGRQWRIICEHTSVPFYMDGSDRAALDLKPEE